MAFLSLKKTGRAKRLEEGNYASPVISARGRHSSSDLGLTLSPGSQISKKNEKALDTVGNGQYARHVSKRRGRTQTTNFPTHVEERSAAQCTSTPLEYVWEPQHDHAYSENQFVIRPSTGQASVQDVRGLSGDEELVANHNVVSSPGCCASYNPGPTTIALSEEDCSKAVEGAQVKSHYTSIDPSPLTFARKRRRVGDRKLPGYLSEYSIGHLRTAWKGNSQFKHPNAALPGSKDSNQAREELTSHLRPDVRHQHGSRAVRSQRTTTSRHPPTENVSGLNISEEAGSGQSSELGEAFALPEIQLQNHRLGEANTGAARIDSTSSSDGEIATENLYVRCTSAKVLSQKKTRPRRSISCYDKPCPMNTDSSSIELIAQNRESSAQVFPSVTCDVACDKLKFLHNSCVGLVSQPSQSSEKHLKTISYRHPFIDNHPSVFSNLSFSNSTLRNSINRTIFDLRQQKSTSVNSALPVVCSITRNIASQRRKRANSLPVLGAIHSEASMYNPRSLQIAPGRGELQNIEDDQFRTNGQADDTLAWGLTAQPRVYSRKTVFCRPPLRFADNFQVARDFTSYLLSNGMVSSETPGVITDNLGQLIMALPSRLYNPMITSRTLEFVYSFSEAGAPQIIYPHDEMRVKAVKANENFKAQNVALSTRCTGYENTIIELRNSIQQREDSIEKLKAAMRDSNSEKEQLRGEVQAWKAQAGEALHLAKIPPSNPPSNDTLYRRIVPKNAMIEGPAPMSDMRVSSATSIAGPPLDTTTDSPPGFPTFGHTTAAFPIGHARNDSTYSSDSSKLIDLTRDDDSTTVPSLGNTSTTISRQSSSQSQPSKAVPEIAEKVTRKRHSQLSWMVEPSNDALRLALPGQYHNQQLNNINGVQRPFVPNVDEAVLDAAEARKNDASYTGCQQKNRVTKTFKATRVTKKQLKEMDGTHAPAPKKSAKKPRQQRTRRAPETPQEKAARLQQEKQYLAEQACLQAAQFQEEALRRQARQEQEDLDAENEMHGYLCDDNLLIMD